MRVGKHGCGVEMFCFSRANHASKNLKKFSEFKTPQVYFIYLFFRRLKIGKSLQRKCANFVDKTLRLVGISLLISAIQRVLRFFLGKLFHKNNRKLFSCVCIA